MNATDRVHDYLDDRLSVDERRAFEAALARDDRLRRRVESLLADREALREGDDRPGPGFYTRARAAFDDSRRARRRSAWMWPGVAVVATSLTAAAMMFVLWDEPEFRETLEQAAVESEPVPVPPVPGDASEGAADEAATTVAEPEKPRYAPPPPSAPPRPAPAPPPARRPATEESAEPEAKTIQRSFRSTPPLVEVEPVTPKPLEDRDVSGARQESARARAGTASRDVDRLARVEADSAPDSVLVVEPRDGLLSCSQLTARDTEDGIRIVLRHPLPDDPADAVNGCRIRSISGRPLLPEILTEPE